MTTDERLNSIIGIQPARPMGAGGLPMGEGDAKEKGGHGG